MICNGKPISVNQQRIARIILDDDLIRRQIVLRITPTKSGRMLISYGEMYHYQSVPIEEFKTISKRQDNLSSYKFAIGTLNLFSNLCIGDNKVSINGLKILYPLKLCLKVIVNEDLDYDIRSGFAELTHRLWSVSETTKKRFQKATMTKVWSFNEKYEKNYDLFLSVGAKTYQEFLDLFEFIEGYLERIFEKMRKGSIQKINFDFTEKIFDLLKNLVQIRIIDSQSDLKQLKDKMLGFLKFDSHHLAPSSGMNESNKLAEEVHKGMMECKVICLEILKEIILIEIDLEIEQILKWIRKRCIENLAKDIKNTRTLKPDSDNQER